MTTPNYPVFAVSFNDCTSPSHWSPNGVTRLHFSFHWTKLILMAFFFLVAVRWGRDCHPAISMVESSRLVLKSINDI
jgi:hypothetical protein